MRNSHIVLPTLVAALLLLGGRNFLAAQEIEIPNPVETPLETRDGLQLKATYYPPIATKIVEVEGKQVVVPKKPVELRETIPIIMLHQYKGSRKDFAEAASRLQAKGHAVIVPDLRGHGDSTTFVNGKLITAAGLKTNDFTAMGLDMRAVKSFLMKKNNEGQLNIEKLCIVGAEMGASLAANFAAYDWKRVQQPGARKLGRDVRALVLLSPQISYRGLPMSKFSKIDKRLLPVTRMQWAKMHREMSIMIVVGKHGKKPYRAAKVFRDSIKLKYPAADNAANDDKRLLLFGLETKLQSTDMLNNKALNAQDDLAHFVNLRLVGKNFPWTKRD